MVLIDTWWNVNIHKDLLFSVFRCFNRYMVECEYCKISYIGSKDSCFNRYMVECESSKPAKYYTFDIGFNRYMVECECSITIIYKHTFNRF